MTSLLRTIVIILLAVTFVGSAALWWRSRTRSDVLGFGTPAGHLQAVGSHRGGFVVALTEVPMGREKAWNIDYLGGPAEDLDEINDGLFDTTALWRSIAGFKFASGTFSLGSQTPAYRAVRVPAWAVLAASGLLLILLARPVLRRRRWVRQGRCRNCGYDLRESPGRCPECGAEPKGVALTVDSGRAGRTEVNADLNRQGRVNWVAGWGTAVLVISAIGAGMAMLADMARSGRNSGMVVQTYDVGDLADLNAWPGEVYGPKIAAVFTHYPRAADRVERIWSLAETASILPAWDIGRPSLAGQGIFIMPQWKLNVIGDHIVLAAPPALHAEYASLLHSVRSAVGQPGSKGERQTPTTKSDPVLRVYNVRHLLESLIRGKRYAAQLISPDYARHFHYTHGIQGLARLHAQIEYDDESVEPPIYELIQILRDIDSKSWRGYGDDGVVGEIDTWAGLLLVHHVPAMHREIEHSLELMDEELGKER